MGVHEGRTSIHPPTHMHVIKLRKSASLVQGNQRNYTAILLHSISQPRLFLRFKNRETQLHARKQWDVPVC